MFSRKKNRTYILAALFCLSFFSLLFGLFIRSENVSAVDYFNGNYTVWVSSYGYDDFNGRGVGDASYIFQNTPLPTTTPSSEGRILGTVSSDNYLEFLVGLGIIGLNFRNVDYTKRYQSAEANVYLYMPDTTFSAFVGAGSHPPELTCYYYRSSGERDVVSGSWNYYSTSSTPIINYVELDCPVVQNSSYDGYTYVDMLIGDQSQQNSLPSNYIYVYGKTGGVWFTSGTFQVASSDNPELNAIENQTNIIENGFNNIYNSINDHYDRENESVDNISNQSPSDIQGTENQKTTDLISALGSLVTAFASIEPAENCEIQLDFPGFVGGSRVINPCQYKEKAPEVVLIGASVFLVIFAMKYWNAMSYKIYEVIRSFIDGTDDTKGEQ